MLSPIIKNLYKSKKLKVYFLISGSHLDKNFGKTINEITNDKIKIFKKIKIKHHNIKNQIYTPLYISEIINKFSKQLKIINPDFTIIYADRYETFGAAIASTQMNIPTIHFEGGDKTEGGTLDDSVRHAITKLSHFHITTNNDAKKRIKKMGEEKWRVKNFGYSILDSVKSKDYATPSEIKKKLNISINRPIVLFTQHPVPMHEDKTIQRFKESIKALKKLAKENIQIIVTYPNSDFGASKLINEIYKLKKNKNIFIYKSLGRYFYHGILALINNSNTRVVCVGNSSSGIKETAIHGCPAINIGPRQSGRLRGINVFDVSHNHKKIFKLIKKCIENEKLIKRCKNTKNIYGKGNTAILFRSFLEKIKINKEKFLTKKITY